MKSFVDKSSAAADVVVVAFRANGAICETEVGAGGGEGEALEYSDRWPTAVHRLLPRVTKTIKRVRAKKKRKRKKVCW